VGTKTHASLKTPREENKISLGWYPCWCFLFKWSFLLVVDCFKVARYTSCFQQEYLNQHKYQKGCTPVRRETGSLIAAASVVCQECHYYKISSGEFHEGILFDGRYPKSSWTNWSWLIGWLYASEVVQDWIAIKNIQQKNNSYVHHHQHHQHHHHDILTLWWYHHRHPHSKIHLFIYRILQDWHYPHLYSSAIRSALKRELQAGSASQRWGTLKDQSKLSQFNQQSVKWFTGSPVSLGFVKWSFLQLVPHARGWNNCSNVASEAMKQTSHMASTYLPVPLCQNEGRFDSALGLSLHPSSSRTWPAGATAVSHVEPGHSHYLGLGFFPNFWILQM